jgi:hypothetical protein
MKTFSVLHIVLFLLAILVYQCAQAQDYVISAKGDSITGEVKPLTYGREKYVQVIPADGKKLSLTIFQVKEFRYKDELFRPVKFENGYTFMKLMKPGYLSLYAFQHENQYAFDGLYLLKKDASGIEVPNLSFKKYVMKFLEDCPVSEKVANGEYGKKQLLTIVDEYNACVNARTIDHGKILEQKKEEIKKITAWDALEEKVKGKPDFTDKGDALEMISDIKAKINRGEKVPRFLLEGLKAALESTDLSTELDAALAELTTN